MGKFEAENDEVTGAGESRCPARLYALRRPKGHKPPIARYSAVLPQTGKVTVLFLGVQAKTPDFLRDAALHELPPPGDAAPVYVDHARFTDPQGYVNHIAALYWFDDGDYDLWRDAPALKQWLDRLRVNPSLGVWWEPVAVNAARMETITFKEFRRGFSGCPVSGLETTECSGYWGAARDRIPSAAYDLFEPSVSASMPAPVPSQPEYRKVQPPVNMAVIRSGVSWEKCEGEQLQDYQERIKPKLDAGMSYLREHPQETGCYSLRQVENIDDRGAKLAEGYSLGAFVSMGHLESWAKDHPSHLAIYTRAMAARRKYQDRLQLRTYNEIFIIDERNPPFEYFNCHPHTGLLPYADEIESAR